MGDETGYGPRWREGSDRTVGCARGRRSIRSDFDRHAHAQDGRVCPGGADQTKGRTINLDDHDAYFRQSKGRRSPLRRIGDLRVSVEAGTSVGAARGDRASVKYE